MTQEVADLKGDLAKIIDKFGFSNAGYSTIIDLSSFVDGAMYNGAIQVYGLNRITSEDIISFSSGTTFVIASGFRLVIDYFVSGSYSSSSGWKTGSFTVPAGSFGRVCIARTTEDSSEIANIYEFTNAVKFQSPVEVENSTNTSNIGLLNQAFVDYSISGKENIGMRYTFQNGGMTNGAITNIPYRVATNELISFDRSVTFTAKTGFRFAIHYFVNNVFNSETGWRTGSFTVDAGSTFKMVISRASESNTEVANITEFTQAITYQSDTDYRISTNHNDIGEIFDNVSTITTPTITAHENGKYVATTGVIGTLDFGSYSDPLSVSKGDVIVFTCIANTAMSAISYCNADLTGITPAVIGESYNVQDYKLISDRTGHIVLSYYTDSTHSLTICRYHTVQNELRAGSVSQFLGKMTVWCGDSIMLGATFNDTKKGWYGRISDACGCYFQKYAEGGATITRGVNPNRTAIVDQIEQAFIDHPDAELIVFDGGCNDADLIGNATGETKPNAFGTFSENDFSGSYDPTTFCGAMETICMKLSQHWLGKHVGYIVPQKMGVANNYHAGYNNYRTYYETAIQICEKWGIPVLNLWDGCYMNPKHNWMCDTNNTMTEEEIYEAGFLYADRQHLTQAGYDYQAPIVNAWLHTI